MNDDTQATAPAQPLQFDHAVDGESKADAPHAPTITCSRCNTQVRSYYYHVDGNSVCAKCKQELERAGGVTRTGGAFIRSAMFGGIAALSGAAIYYGVIAAFSLEIGIVAILIGFIVGKAVRSGARGGGGRRYQILAAGLTYLSVGMAYAPVAYKGIVDAKRNGPEAVSSASADSADASALAEAEDEENAKEVEDSAAASLMTVTAAGDPTAAPVELTWKVILLGLGATILLIFVLPVIVVIGSLPSGLISALIIGFGIRTAWKMTDGEMMTITGPYKVGATSAPTPAPAT
jgi:Flp pilus assembly protein TadB